MIEDWALCTRQRHHRQKLVLFLAAMREHADALRTSGHRVEYHELPERRAARPFEEVLTEFVDRHRLAELVHFEIEDHFFADRIHAFCAQHGLAQRIVDSPMFLTSRTAFAAYLARTRRPLMAGFYVEQRKRLKVLLRTDGTPEGGRWSFDEDNRHKLPRTLHPPEVSPAPITAHAQAVIRMVDERFPDHPGRGGDFWWPVRRVDALAWLERFLAERFADYGPYQDAITQRSDTVFHSALSPMLNLGLILPQEVLEAVLGHTRDARIPVNSVEGFVRQLIGWREFVRGIYHHFDERQCSSNHFGAHRLLADSWWDGSTGIPPLDDAIRMALRRGWTHHILRLMVIGNLMNLCEIEPACAHDWFMAMHVDSSDWVMGPNVYGMALFSDGGVFATKPYVAGSNYLRKMSDYGKGPWCDVVDGLYWRFVARHRNVFSGNQRLSMMVRQFDRIDSGRRETILAAAEAFLARHTIVGGE